MDCNDNDISCHNLQLVEGRSETSSKLRPYDFPKFDFDDNLQGQLRFDSLVETEVFLGIQSQEDNNWIEDYSGGSNGMEFNSTPADSCSIARRSNVWSEATSSESVEMLLNSVGQEEIMPGESFIPESNAGHDHGTSLAAHVVSSSELGTQCDEYLVVAEATVSQAELLKDYPASQGHVQLPEAEKPSVAPTNVEFVCGKDKASIHERKHSCDDENFNESRTVAEKSISCAAEEDSAYLTRVCTSVSFSYNLGVLEQVNVVVAHESCSDNGEKENVCTESEQEETKKFEEITVEGIIPSYTKDNSVGLVAELRVPNSQEAVNTGHVCVRETANIPADGADKLKSSEGDDTIVSFTTSDQIGKAEVKVLPLIEMSGSVEDCQNGSVVVVDSTDQHGAELDSLNAGHCASVEHKMDSSVLLTCRQDDDKVDEVHTSAAKVEICRERPLLSIDDNKVPIDISDCIDKAKTSITSEVEPLCSALERKETKNVEGCHRDSIVTVEESAAHIPTVVTDDSKQVIEENLANRQNNFSGSADICKNNEKDIILPTVVRHVDLKTLINDQSSESDIKVGVKVNDVAGHAKSSWPAEQDDNEKQDPTVTGLPHSNKKNEEAFDMIVSDTSVGTQVASIAKGEVSVAAAAKIALSKMPMKSLQMSESPSAEAVNSPYLYHSQVHSVGDKSSLKESFNSDVVCGEIQEVEEKKESAQAAEVDKASCGSPTIISSNEPSLMDKGNQDDCRDSEVRDAQLTSEDPKEVDASVDDTTFTFKVNALPASTEKSHGSSWSPFPSDEKCDSPMVVKDINLSGTKTARTPTQKSLLQSAQIPDGEHVHGISKGTSESKVRRASSNGTTKESSKKKGNQVKKTKQESLKGDKVSDSLVRTASSGPNVHLGKVQPFGHFEQSNTKLSGGAAVPDLNTSALNTSNSPSAFYQQPFTDLQQVQLRAQIFVYGSLIQGTPPDEACMVSAFGSSDGRTIWEPVWRTALERVRNKKSNSGAAETPLQSESAARASESTVKQGLHSSKVLSSPKVRAGGSKGTPADIANPAIPLSSPLWSISTPLRDTLLSSGTLKGPIVDYHHAVAPLHSFQTPPMRTFAGHTSWPSQPFFPGPWLTSPQTSTFSSSVLYQPVTMTETVKLTPVKDTPRPLTSVIKQSTSSPIQTAVPSPTYVGVSLFPDKKLIASAEKHSVDSKPRKRKKVQASDFSQVFLTPEAQTQPVVNLIVSSSPAVVPTPAALTSSAVRAFPSADAMLQIVTPDAIGVGSIDHLKNGELDAGKVAIFSAETFSNVAEAKSQAEDAATLAATAVGHSEDLWRQLAKQKECGLNSEVEVNLASAALAVAAASSVAKAAAAAAKVACNIALQAKLMADEALLSEKMNGLVSSSCKHFTDVHDAGNATPASMLKDDGITNQSISFLVAAKEAATRRVDAASAASKQAENLDAIVKAAELAAEAVSQAGKIVAMREPLPLSDLIEAGPEGYWKSTEPTFLLAEKLKDSNKGAAGLEDAAVIPVEFSKEYTVLKGGVKTASHAKVNLRKRSNDSLLTFGTTKSSRVISESDPLPGTDGDQNDQDELVGALPEDSIKEGFPVEVFKHGDRLKTAWYSANVLTLDDGKAYVGYTDLLSEEGFGSLCEWVSLEGKANKAPTVRSPLSSTASQSKWTRKRRRAALEDYAWGVGDRVDVWVDNCWWEGVVTEKDKNDETALKVHFPAHGETATVRSCDLRTSRSWSNGKWVECCSTKGHNDSKQSDTPQEKRQKMGSPAVPGKGNNELSNDMNSISEKPEESKLLDLSTSDSIFNVGKSTTTDNKYAGRRPLRTGQQKEKSRVIFGVPKPTGKKRKFMEVSKHFPANKSDKSNETNNSVKFAKYLMPQAPTARGWKVSLRSESKQTVEPRSTVPSSRQSSRTLSQRNNLNSTLTRDLKLRNRGKEIEDSVGHDEDTSEKVEHVSSVMEKAAEAPLSSFVAQPSTTSSKKISSLNAKSERLMRGKPIYSGGKLSKIENKVSAGGYAQSITDVTEPRRSNRRMQPTHRLLEGLQSSITIPKMPSVSHDKVQRNPSRNMSSRGK